MTIKEINTYSFIGNLGEQGPEKEWKEIDEEKDVIHCKETFDRPCLLLKPLSILTTALPGENGEERRLPVLTVVWRLRQRQKCHLCYLVPLMRQPHFAVNSIARPLPRCTA